MRIPFSGPLDLEATLHSGQAFRWRRGPGEHHSGFIANEPCTVVASGQSLLVQAPPRLSVRAIRLYFRLDAGHDDFLRRVKRDRFLDSALAAFPGLRLLRQDPWEMLVSFLLSQNSNEAKIRRSIEALCRLAGRPVQFLGERLHRFPSPSRLAALDGVALRSTGMGYRAPFVASVARRVASGRFRPQGLADTPYESAFERLLKLPGVGEKVADCILLYGCDHRRAFPTDVWVRRFIRETYLRRGPRPGYRRIRAFALRRFGDEAGYAQHYLFHYRRVVGKLSNRSL